VCTDTELQNVLIMAGCHHFLMYSDFLLVFTRINSVSN